VTDKCLSQLKEHESLEELGLSCTDVTDKGVNELRMLRKLRILHLNVTKVTDESLKTVKELKNLQKLSLTATGVTDKGMEELQDLGDLETLDLASTKVTDEGLKCLKPLKKLKWLDVCETKVTEAAVTELKRAVPGLNVTSGDLLPFRLPKLEFARKPETQPLPKVVPYWVLWLLAAGASAAAFRGLFRRNSAALGSDATDRGPRFVKLGSDGKGGIMYRNQ
jgi:hypothetical protein